MITIVLLTAVLITFAAVYPSGYKLNRKTARATQAAKAASAIAEEIQSVPFNSPGGTGVVLQNLEDNPWSAANSGTWHTNYQLFPDRHVEEPFFLEDDTSIVVDVLQDTGEDVFANITVTVSYREVGSSSYQSTGAGDIQRVTIATAKAANR